VEEVRLTPLGDRHRSGDSPGARTCDRYDTEPEIASDRELLAQFPASRAQFLVHDSAPPPGTKWRQTDLARTLQLISRLRSRRLLSRSDRRLIVAEMRRGGGLITKDDLRRYRAKWRTPVQLSYRGHTIYSMPPPSSGGVTMGEILNILEGYDTLPAFGTAAYVHLVTEAMRRAFIDRNRWLGDPDFVDAPLDRLLSKSYAATLRSQIDPKHATPTPPQSAGGEAMHTTHYSIVDAQGNAAAVTTTLNGGFGSGVTVTGAGFPTQQRDGRLRDRAGQAQHVRAVQGEAKRRGRQQADAVGDDASIRTRQRRNLQMWWARPRADDHHECCAGHP